MGLAAIKNGVVENVIAVDADTLASSIQHLEANGFECVVTDVAGPGWLYDNGVFTAPDVVPAVNPTEWLIDIGPFMDRFGANKIPILASSDATVRAVTQDMMARKWIDLQRADVGTAIDLLISKGFTLDKTAILTTPVLAEENLALRKLYF